MKDLADQELDQEGFEKHEMDFRRAMALTEDELKELKIRNAHAQQNMAQPDYLENPLTGKPFEKFLPTGKEPSAYGTQATIRFNLALAVSFAAGLLMGWLIWG